MGFKIYNYKIFGDQISLQQCEARGYFYFCSFTNSLRAKLNGLWISNYIRCSGISCSKCELNKRKKYPREMQILKAADTKQLNSNDWQGSLSGYGSQSDLWTNCAVHVKCRTASRVRVWLSVWQRTRAIE